MPDVERESWWQPELLPDDRPGTAQVIQDVTQHIARFVATLPKGYDLEVRTRDAIDEPDDLVHDSPARRAARWGGVSSLVSALWVADAYLEISPTGRTLLHVAAAAPIEKAMPTIIDKLVRKGVPLDAQERVLGHTALHLAVERCVNTPVSRICDDRYQRRMMAQRVERLLAAGADPNVTNHWGHTALHQVFCARGPNLLGHPIPWVLIDRLLLAGANADMPSRVGITPRELILSALQQPVPCEDHGQRQWWVQRQAPALDVDVVVLRVAREAVALRLDLAVDPESSVLIDPRRRL